VKTYIGRLPYPPTMNSIWRNIGGNRTIKSKGYRVWEKLADGYAVLSPRITLEGPVRAEFVYHRPDKRRRDVANLEKAVSDTLVRWGILGDDSQIHDLRLRWAADGEISAGEVRVYLEEIEKAP